MNYLDKTNQDRDRWMKLPELPALIAPPVQKVKGLTQSGLLKLQRVQEEAIRCMSEVKRIGTPQRLSDRDHILLRDQINPDSPPRIKAQVGPGLHLYETEACWHLYYVEMGLVVRIIYNASLDNSVVRRMDIVPGAAVSWGAKRSWPQYETAWKVTKDHILPTKQRTLAPEEPGASWTWKAWDWSATRTQKKPSTWEYELYNLYERDNPLKGRFQSQV